MDVCDVNVTDEDGFLAGSMMTKAKNILIKERTLDQSCGQRIVFLPLHPDTGATLPRFLPARCH